MFVDYNTAITCFHSFDSALQNPYLHPDYIVADSARDTSLRPSFFVYQNAGRSYYHGFHRSLIGVEELSDIQSAYGYGGPVASTEDRVFLREAWDYYADLCKEEKILAEFIRFHPLIKNWRFYNGEVIDDRQTVWIDLEKQDILLHSFTPRARTAVRKALQQGLSVEWPAPEYFFEIFPDLYRQTMQEIGATDFYFFSDAYFKQLANLKDLHLAVCKFNGDIVAAAMFIGNKPFLEYYLSAATAEGKKLNAVNLILFIMAEKSQANEYRFLHLGGGTDNNPKNSLFFFKTSFSKLTGDYKIGKKIHLPLEYEKIKATWEEQHGKTIDRVLFYRF